MSAWDNEDGILIYSSKELSKAQPQMNRIPQKYLLSTASPCTLKGSGASPAQTLETLIYLPFGMKKERLFCY